MSYFLAVDAGGSKTEFLLADEERELGRVTCASIKRLNATDEEATAELHDALIRLRELTGVGMNKVRQTCIGTSGITVPLVVDWLRGKFSQSVSGQLLIVGDVDIALDAVFPGGRGVLVLSGTGSNVAGRGADGKIITAGGWGPMLADQGAGYWIGLEGLRRGFLAIDEQRSTNLLEEARRLWGLSTVQALIAIGNADPRPRYADLAPLVVSCAAQGDEIAGEILDQGATDLAYLAQLVIDRIQASDPADQPLPVVATAGSILGKVERVRDKVMGLLRKRYPELQFDLEPADPVVGALYRARQSS